jgi:hypothetical protein
LALTGVCILTVGIAACGGSVPSPDSGTVTETPAVPTIDPFTKPIYSSYSPYLLHTGSSAVLFFAKSGRLFSQRSERVITEAYGSGAANVSTFRIDLGTATGMALQYGVFVEDTFVLIDGEGNRKRLLVHPNAGELRTLLRTQD